MERRFVVGILAHHLKDYLDVLVRHANELRATEVKSNVELDDYGVTEPMLDELDTVPYRSKK